MTDDELDAPPSYSRTRLWGGHALVLVLLAATLFVPIEVAWVFLIAGVLVLVFVVAPPFGDAVHAWELRRQQRRRHD